jgi:S-methylmethionine-dependent homocysteine/selenocysteine methylase
LNYIDEGIGITLAAQSIGIPVALSYTVETDGRLLTGESIQEIIDTIDKATNNGPAYYMINCAHPTHFIPTLSKIHDRATSSAQVVPSWMTRIGGIRGNASKLSHAELDECLELDEGNPSEFGKENLEILKILPQVNVIGGCCGTDINHVKSILANCADHFSKT